MFPTSRQGLTDLATRQAWQRAAELAGEAMQDNPNHIAAYRGSPALRARRHAHLLAAVFEVNPGKRGVAAVDGDGSLLGIAVATPSDSCQPRPWQVVRLVPALASMGAATAVRVARWISAWTAWDLPQPHLHIGPVAVREDERGQGVGSLMLEALTTEADEADLPAYLETDRQANLAVYRRHGFELIGTTTVLGVRNWFMVRPISGSGSR